VAIIATVDTYQQVKTYQTLTKIALKFTINFYTSSQMTSQ